MTYETQLARKVMLESNVENAQREFNDVAGALSRLLNVPEKNELGLTNDAIKLRIEYKFAKANFDKAFQTLRNFNKVFVKDYGKRYRKEVLAKRGK